MLASDAALLRLGSGPWAPVPTSGDPHALADVAVAILCGALAVAENGAVGLDGREARPRALPVICERLVLLLQTRARSSPRCTRRSPACPTARSRSTTSRFVAGPSKTADIEGALVLGAHGPRELAVFAIDG